MLPVSECLHGGIPNQGSIPRAAPRWEENKLGFVLLRRFSEAVNKKQSYRRREAVKLRKQDRPRLRARLL